MASTKNSKTEKKSKDGESSRTAGKASKPRKEAEDIKKNKKKKEKEKEQKRKNKEVEKKKNKRNKLSNGNVKDHEVLIVPSSSTESQAEEEQGREEDSAEITNGRTSGTKPKKGKRKQDDGEDENEVEEKEGAAAYKFPMRRIRTIIRGEDPDLRAFQEAIFVINIATEKFLEQLTQDAYACSVQDRKKSLGYKHLSSVVSKQRRYDFLSDFVPEKIRAEDALRERNSGGNGGG